MNDDYAVTPRDEETLVTKKVVAEHKLFYLDFKRNQRGRFLKITEKDGRFRSTVIVPEEAVRELSLAIVDIAALCTVSVPPLAATHPSPPVLVP